MLLATSKMLSNTPCCLPSCYLLKALELEAMLRWYQCRSRVGVFNRISATIGRLCFWCCRSFTQTTHYEGHEDLSSCKAVLEVIKFNEKPSCVKMDF